MSRGSPYSPWRTTETKDWTGASVFYCAPQRNSIASRWGLKPWQSLLAGRWVEKEWE